jgi:hypothetical protein
MLRTPGTFAEPDIKRHLRLTKTVNGLKIVSRFPVRDTPTNRRKYVNEPVLPSRSSAAAGLAFALLQGLRRPLGCTVGRPTI